MEHDDKLPIAIPFDEVKQMAAALAEELRAAAGDGIEPISGTGGGSRHRGLPEDLRARFIDIRAALYQRGIYDPVLVRFDTATVSQASTREIADQLEALAGAVS